MELLNSEETICVVCKSKDKCFTVSYITKKVERDPNSKKFKMIDIYTPKAENVCSEDCYDLLSKQDDVCCNVCKVVVSKWADYIYKNNRYLVCSDRCSVQQAINIGAKMCSYCHKTPERDNICNKCKKVYYCNRDCQLAHWQTHKLVCKEN